MSKEMTDSLRREETSRPLYGKRDLSKGGKLYLFAQVHGNDYPKEVLEQDISDISPSLLILENIRPIGWNSLEVSQEFNQDTSSQIRLAERLGIPVVFPDISGVYDKRDLETDPFYRAVGKENFLLNESIKKGLVLISEGMIGSVILGTALTALLCRKDFSRKGFLKFAGFVGAGAALAYLPFHYGERLKSEYVKKNAELVSVSGPVNQDKKTLLLYKLGNFFQISVVTKRRWRK